MQNAIDVKLKKNDTPLKYFENDIYNKTKKYDSLAEIGKTYLFNNDVFNTQRIIDSLLNIDEHYYIAKNFQVGLLLINKEYEKAIQKCDSILIDFDNAKSYELKGLAYSQLNEYKLALIYFSSSNILHETAFVHLKKALIYIKLNDLQSAFKSLNKALDIDPSYSTAIITRGQLYFDLKEYKKAINDFNLVSPTSENYLFALNFKAECYRKLKDYETAIKICDKILLIDPHNKYAYFTKADCIEDEKYYDNDFGHIEIIGFYTTVIEFDSLSDYSFYKRANSYKLLRIYENSIKDLNTAISINPYEYIYYSDRDIIVKWNKKYKVYRKQYLQEGINSFLNAPDSIINPESTVGFLYYDLYDCDKKSEFLDTALMYLEKSLINFPSAPYVYRQMGEIYRQELKDFKKAVTAFKKAIDLDPNFYYGYLQYAWALQDNKEYQKALDIYNEIEAKFEKDWQTERGIKEMTKKIKEIK